MSRNRDFVRFELIAKLSSTKKTPAVPRSDCTLRFKRRNSPMTLWLDRKRITSPKNPVTVQNSQHKDNLSLIRPEARRDFPTTSSYASTTTAPDAVAFQQD